jgi:hypothetical protein
LDENHARVSKLCLELLSVVQESNAAKNVTALYALQFGYSAELYALRFGHSAELYALRFGHSAEFACLAKRVSVIGV